MSAKNNKSTTFADGGGENQNETIPISRKADHGLHPLFTRGGARYRHVQKYLLDAARAQGRERLSLLLEAICATGIRVSEAWYITVEAARESPSRGRYAPPCCLLNCAASCCNMPESKKNRLRQDFSHGKRQKPVAQADMGEFVFVLEYILSKSSFRRDHKQQRPRSANHALFTRFINSLLFGSLYCSCTSAHRH